MQTDKYPNNSWENCNSLLKKPQEKIMNFFWEVYCPRCYKVRGYPGLVQEHILATESYLHPNLVSCLVFG